MTEEKDALESAKIQGLMKDSSESAEEDFIEYITEESGNKE